MNLLVLGFSHQTAPMDLLEQAALPAGGDFTLTEALHEEETVEEAVVVATCNRLEVYAVVSSFHGGVSAISDQLSAATGVDTASAAEHMFLRYGQAAAEHIFAVAAGLDSMAIGESQILGQVRHALRMGQEIGSVKQVLDPLLQRALRAAKRAHNETDLDQAGPGLVDAAWTEALRILSTNRNADTCSANTGSPANTGTDNIGSPATPTTSADVRVAVVGAGAMSGLAIATLHRLGVADLAVINRSKERAQRLVDRNFGHVVDLNDNTAVLDALAKADVIMTCTGAVGHVITTAMIKAARANRTAPQVLIDLALPRDIDPTVREVHGVDLIDLTRIGELASAEHNQTSTVTAEQLVLDEVHTFVNEQRSAAVAPTLAALRKQSEVVVERELARIMGRLGEEQEPIREEIRLAMHRVASKLLHTPTVRMKSLVAERNDGETYVAALRQLFDLDDVECSSVAQVLHAVPKNTERVSSP